MGINVKLVDRRTLRRGYVCGNAKDDPPAETAMFYAQIIVIEHQGIKVVQIAVLNKINKRGIVLLWLYIVLLCLVKL